MPSPRGVSPKPRQPDSTPPRLIIVFGDQLDPDSPLIRSLAPHDTVLMMEVAAESRHVPSHAQRTALFLSAMRHFAAALQLRNIPVRYITLDDPDNTGSFETEITRAAAAIKPSNIACIHPGEWRVLAMLQRVQTATGIPLTIWPDDHFLTTPQEFEAWAKGRSSLTMEFFYREQRRKTGYLMQGRGSTAKPIGGAWNFDKENRLPFGKTGPSPRPRPPQTFEPDDTTRAVLEAIQRVLPDLPGDTRSFAWPVTRPQALQALDDFITHRLPNFGPFEDAMWSNEPTLYHSTLSSALNLKLLNPRECCERAIAAYHAGKAPLQSVEAFVRQLIGWREFIRAVYWLEGPSYEQRNSLNQHGQLPPFYWTAQTDMACLKSCIGQVIQTGFGHHIQRLMVTGNFALIAGVHPRAVSDWYLGMFVDGIDWVTLPNALGMVMHADRRPAAPRGVTGLVGTKPYAASGKYIQRMSNYCSHCRYDPAERTGPTACPFTVFYWDFLIRTRDQLADNQRMAMILKNVDRMTPQARTQITIDADLLRKKLGITTAARAIKSV
ncbi:MAG: cryptochrome/photolyase family protein [Planctomycetes bacterium]|nr:cryptochrome/photolyase family protein [Planctomycetota bacterium]